MGKDNKLAVRWSKRENDIIGYHPLGISTKSDLHYLFGVFTKEVQEELERRGYDIKTIKFEIQVDPAKRPDRFPTLLKQMQEDTPAGG